MIQIVNLYGEMSGKGTLTITTYDGKDKLVPVSASATWGAITGTLSLQADLQSELNNKVPYTGATSDVILDQFGTYQKYIEFNTSPTILPINQGSMYWNVDRQSVSLIMNGTTGELMQDSYYYVKNQSGSTITKGTVVMAAGTLGASGRILIVPFLADGTYPSTYCMGVTSEDIVDGADGMVLNFGQIRNIDTSSYSDGDLLYASSTTPGAFTTTVPTAPENIVLLAIVIHAASNGVIHVRPTFGSNINDDEGVKIVSPANGDVLMYNSTTGLWYNGVVSGGGGGTTWGSITGTLSNQTDLQSALNAKYDASNPAGYIDASALAPYLTTTTAAATYYPLTNPSGYISGITSGDVTTALGYTPYDSTNPAGYIDNSALSPYLTIVTAVATYYPLTNPSGYITGISFSDVTTALGYTPASETKTVTINGNTQTIGSNPNFTISGSAPSGTMILLYTDEVEDTGVNSTANVKTYSLASNSYSYILAECEVGFLGGANQTCQMDFTLDIAGVVSRTGSIRQPATGSGDYMNQLGNIKLTTTLTAGGTISISVTEVSNGATFYVYSLRVYGII